MPAHRPSTRPNDQRAAERFDTALAVDLDGSLASARNISATGVYLETSVELVLGSLMNLNVQFTQGGRKHWLACEGKVVRVTQADGRHGAAARLLTPFFSPGQEQYVAAAARR